MIKADLPSYIIIADVSSPFGRARWVALRELHQLRDLFVAVSVLVLQQDQLLLPGRELRHAGGEGIAAVVFDGHAGRRVAVFQQRMARFLQ